MRECMIIIEDTKVFTCEVEPKVTFVNELQVGSVVVPVRIELDFSGVHTSQHERVLSLAQQIYHKDKYINGF